MSPIITAPDDSLYLTSMVRLRESWRSIPDTSQFKAVLLNTLPSGTPYFIQQNNVMSLYKWQKMNDSPTEMTVLKRE